MKFVLVGLFSSGQGGQDREETQQLKMEEGNVNDNAP